MVVTAKAVASGSMWSYGAQVASIVMQFAYAAVTSRMVGPDVFGIYSVAVLVANLIAILSAAGLGQSIARSAHALDGTIRGLATISFGYGVAAVLLISPLAPAWATLWGNPQAINSIMLVGLSAVFAPSVGLLSGLLRRRRQFRQVAISTVIASSLALISSAGLVAIFRSPEALIAAPALTQVFTYFALQASLRWKALPGVVGRDVIDHLSFGWRVSVANLLAYGIENVGRWAVSRAVGQSALGFWNRADVITTVPFDRLQGAMMQALYPELGKDRENTERVRRVWTDVLIVVGWISIPASAFLAGAIPSLVPIVFGPDWNDIIGIAVILSFAAGFRGVSVQLASALEAAGRFGWIWASHGVLLAVQICGAIGVSVTGSLWYAIFGMLAVPLIRHAMQVTLCASRGILDSMRLLRGYIVILLLSAVCWSLAYSASVFALSLDANPWICVAVLGLALAIVALLTFAFRKSIPIFALIRQYGLGRSGM
ncbi:O-antigen/teichoic acid export membrane protein [Paenarthrobacter nicotinovorans]|uniref:O-antigen/teichoic acid export membrane protein n=1 Tax=Paenarthrobacter nicotinovorans TaxID=29320 RepID=A0ABT9TGA9_PAENI|nr:oligosaccharide flippase family protein [Paenarthrobacter nicotinovorans]MDQ0100644.1 O-antigen/teichoic acid export membrane protein [Paenarthrobacter nicotinovorans]